MDDDNITRFPVRPRPDPDDPPPLSLVTRSTCKHLRIEIDDECSEVTCGDCGVGLNPVAVLRRMAREDDRLRWRREALRDEVASLSERVRYTCGSCGQVNNLTRPVRTRTQSS